MASTHSPDTDTLFNAAQRLRAQLAQLENTLSLQMNEHTILLKPLGAALRQKNCSKKTTVSTIPKKHTQTTLQQPHRHAHRKSHTLVSIDFTHKCAPHAVEK